MRGQRLNLRSSLALAVGLLSTLSLAGCMDDWLASLRSVAGGNASIAPEQRVLDGNAVAGRALVASGDYGCAACHHIPGVRGAEGVVGPPLSGYRRRKYVAGVVPNTTGNLIRFIQNAPVVAPGTAMPNLDLTREQARDIAAFLYTLDGPDERR